VEHPVLEGLQEGWKQAAAANENMEENNEKIEEKITTLM